MELEPIDNVVRHFKESGVKCRKIEDNRIGMSDFIAIFGLGSLTRKEIVEKIKENDLALMFFEGAIEQDERNRKARS